MGLWPRPLRPASSLRSPARLGAPPLNPAPPPVGWRPHWAPPACLGPAPLSAAPPPASGRPRWAPLGPRAAPAAAAAGAAAGRRWGVARWASSGTVAASQVEIEVRFHWDEAVEARIAALAGGGPALESRFVDVYFDGPNHCLTLGNAWLRLRNEAWELKVPLPEDSASYLELQDEGDIRAEISARLGGPALVEAPPGASLAAALAAAGVRPFAELRTRRRSYALRADVAGPLGLPGLRADLDCEEATGHRVGELEAVLPPAWAPGGARKVRAALEAFVEREGWELHRDGSGNKLLHYLAVHDPGHLAALRAAMGR